MVTTDHVTALRELQSQQETHPLSILKLSEPIITSTQNVVSPSKRASDVSNSEIENPTPTTLEADLLHYKVTLIQNVCHKCSSITDALDGRISSPSYISPTSNK